MTEYVTLKTKKHIKEKGVKLGKHVWRHMSEPV